MLDLSQSIGDMQASGIAQQALDSCFRDLQGNILKPHGRAHIVFLGVAFDRGQAEASRSWAAAFADDDGQSSLVLTSAFEQAEQSRRRREALAAGAEHRQEAFAQFLVTPSGAQHLGLPVPADEAWSEGMPARGARLGDPPVEDWEEAWQARPLDAVVLLAHSEGHVLAEQIGDLKSQLAAIGAQILFEERGTALRRQGRLIEPFGFADGISQPDFYSTRDDSLDWDPHAALGLALVEEADGGHYGSFAVLRKLAQDIAGWNATVKRVTVERTGEPATEQSIALTEAFAMGRFRDGTPVVRRGQPDAKLSGFNDFSYEDDPSGRRCPFFSHLRKSNPRGEARFLTPQEQRSRRIVRRGLPYGGDEQGLLFFCFQSRIDQQFEAIQRTWCNSPFFPRFGVGRDPVAGFRGSGSLPSPPPSWPAEWDASGPGSRIDLQEHVFLRGGVYLYAPSLAALRRLS